MLRAVRSGITVLTGLLALLGSAWAGTPAATAAATPRLQLAPCRLEHPLGVVSLEAECGRLLVPEDHARPDSRALLLHVARIPALSRQPRPEPLFVLAGGPGLGATTFYTGVAAAFARIHRDRDIILVDQRGTGRSHALQCPFDEQQLWDADVAATAAVMRQCRERLSADQDLAQYTTSVAVKDLDAARRALGVPRIALYGSSYGTRVAQHYARRYPAHTAALILDGVVPPTEVLGPRTPLVAEAALERIFARCREDQACRARFGDPAADYRQLREQLAAAPVEVALADPRSGEPRQIRFDAAAFAGALRLASYTDQQAALLPLTLHLARAQRQYAPLAAQFLLAAAGYDAVLAYGMHNSVVCAEDVPFFAREPVDRAALARTFLGTAQLDALEALCEGWPRGPVDGDLHAPLVSDVPTLLLSGGADPVTPAAYGEQAARTLRAAQHIVIADQGHGQLLQPCVDRLMAQFLDQARQGTKPQLDAGCTRRVRPAPFFLSLNGPAP